MIFEWNLCELIRENSNFFYRPIGKMKIKLPSATAAASGSGFANASGSGFGSARASGSAKASGSGSAIGSGFAKADAYTTKI